MPIDVAVTVAAAWDLVAAEGLDKLTVRRLAAGLGVQAPALYWHFSGKRALLDHMTDALVRPVVEGLPPVEGGRWQEWLADAGLALHTALVTRRDAALVALGADLMAARALGDFAERTVAVLLDAGFPAADATRAAGVLIQLVLGRAAEDQARPAVADEEALISAETFPFPLMARGLRERRASGATVEDDCRYALGLLIAGLGTSR
jgi:TetR/AcrR family tetracycline transcriptional repressor